MSDPTTITVEPGTPCVDIVREFDAPVGVVFRVHTDRDLYGHWLGPREAPLEITDCDPTVGGRWADGVRGEGGVSFGLRGAFHTVNADALLVQTLEFDGASGQIGLSLATLEALDGRPRITIRETGRFFTEQLGFVETFRTPETGPPVHVAVRLGGLVLGFADFVATRAMHGLDVDVGPKWSSGRTTSMPPSRARSRPARNP